MHPLQFPVIADENIHDDVISYLRGQGVQVETVKERNLCGASDMQIATLAHAEGKVVLTHDADFGRIVHFAQDVKAAIIFIRPGHIDASFTIQTLQSILQTELKASLPFLLVAERNGNDIKIRLRTV